VRPGYGIIDVPLTSRIFKKITKYGSIDQIGGEFDNLPVAGRKLQVLMEYFDGYFARSLPDIRLIYCTMR
jgi:hypothetical protein